MIRLRASAAPLAWMCAESLSVESLRVSDAGEPADLGSAFHKWAECIDRQNRPDIGELAARYGVKRDDLDRTCRIAYPMWRDDLAKWFGECATETRLVHVTDDLHTSATLDRHGVIGDEARMLDWKTGRKESDAEQQLRVGAWLLCHHHPEVREVFAVAAYTTLGFWDPYTWTREQLEDWRGDMLTRLRNGQGTFNVGAHCENCPRFTTCPGGAQYRAACREIIETGSEPLTQANAKAIGPAVADEIRRVRFIERWCKAYLEQRRAEIAAIGGEIDAGGGRVMMLQERVRRRYIDPVKGVRIMREHGLSDYDIAGCMSISAAKAEDAIEKKLPTDAKRGSKKQAREAFRADVRTAGALRVASSLSLADTKKQECTR